MTTGKYTKIKSFTHHGSIRNGIPSHKSYNKHYYTTMMMFFKNQTSPTSSGVQDCTFDPVGKRRWRKSVHCDICGQSKFLARMIRCDACPRSAHARCALKKFVRDHQQRGQVFVAASKDSSTQTDDVSRPMVATRDVACGPDENVWEKSTDEAAATREIACGSDIPFADCASQTGVAISDVASGDDTVIEDGDSPNNVAISHVESGDEATGVNVDMDEAIELVVALPKTATPPVPTPFRPLDCRFAVASGHTQLVRRLQFIIMCKFGPNIERILFVFTVKRIVAPAAADGHLAIKAPPAPPTSLVEVTTSAYKRVMPLDVDDAGKQVVTLPVLINPGLSVPRRHRRTENVVNHYKLQLRRIQILVCITREFGPQIERVLFAATVKRDVASAAASGSRAIMAPPAPPPSPVEITSIPTKTLDELTVPKQDKEPVIKPVISPNTSVVLMEYQDSHLSAVEPSEIANIYVNDSNSLLSYETGQFTGHTGTKEQSPAILSPGYQPLVNKDQLENVARVNSGVGIINVEGLGNNQSGKHPVRLLYELCAKRKWDRPTYDKIEESGPEHRKTFIMAVNVNGLQYSSSRCPTIKLAKLEAAKAMLIELNKINDWH